MSVQQAGNPKLKQSSHIAILTASFITCQVKEVTKATYFTSHLILRGSGILFRNAGTCYRIKIIYLVSGINEDMFCLSQIRDFMVKYQKLETQVRLSQASFCISWSLDLTTADSLFTQKLQFEKCLIGILQGLGHLVWVS